MKVDDIIVEVYENILFRRYATKICPRLVDEILSELYESVLKMDAAKVVHLYESKNLDKYCISIIYNMVVNPQSPLNKVYNHDHINIDNVYSDIEISDDEDIFISDESIELIEDIKKFIHKRSKINEEEFYNSMVFSRSFFGGETFQEISDSIGVTKTSVFQTVKAVKQIVNTKFKNKYIDVRFR